MFGSSVEPDLLDTMNSVRARSTLLRGRRRPGPGRSSRGRAGPDAPSRVAEGVRQHLRARGSSRPCRAAETSVNRAACAVARDRARARRRARAGPSAISSQPSQFASSRAGPERGVALPQTPRTLPFALASPRARPSTRRRRSSAGGERLSSSARASPSRFARRAAQQLVERLVEQPHAVGQQPVGDLVERDAEPVRASPASPARRRRPRSSVGRARAVVAERVERRRRHRVDRVRADQRLDVEHVPSRPGSSCPCSPTAGAGSARPCAASASQRSPREELLVALRRRASRSRSRPCPRAAAAVLAVDRSRAALSTARVDPADEEARDRRDPRRRRRPRRASASSPAM